LYQVKTQGRNLSDEFQFGTEERKLLDDFAKARTEASRLERIRLFQKRVETVVSDRQEKANDEAGELSKAEVAVKDLRSKCLTQKSTCDEAQAEVEKFEQMEKEYNSFGQEIAPLIALQERVSQEANNLVKQIKHAEKCEDVARRYKLLLEQIVACDQRLNKLPLVKELYKGLTNAQSKKNGLDNKLDQLKSVDQELSTAKSKEIDAEKLWSQLETDPTTGDFQTWGVLNITLGNQEKEVGAALQALGGDSEKVTCPTCNHPLSQHHRGDRLRHLRTWLEQELPNQSLQLQEQKMTLDQQRETWQQNKDGAFEAWEKARKSVGEAQRRVDERDEFLRQYNLVMSELEAAQKAWDESEEVQPYDPTENERVIGKQNELKKQASQIKDDSDLYNSLPNLSKTLKDKNEESKGYTEKINELRQRQSEIGYDNVPHGAAKVAQSKAQNALSKIQSELQPAELNSERRKGVAELAQQAAARAKSLQCQLEDDITQFWREDQLFTLLKTFHDYFFKANTEQVCQRASELISHAVEDGSILGIEFDERGQLYYLDASNHRRLVTNTRPSGGEKALIGLCLRVALAEQAQFIARTGKLRFLVLDEVLSSLDDERRDAVQQIFEDVQQRGIFEHIIMITHLHAVKQHWRAHGLKVQKVGTKASRVTPVDIQDIGMNFEKEEE
jgi:DNA repair exonuclease SbcCD ATPase subunit